MIFFKVIVVVSIIRKKCVIVIVSIIHFSSIVPSSGYYTIVYTVYAIVSYYMHMNYLDIYQSTILKIEPHNSL